MWSHSNNNFLLYRYLTYSKVNQRIPFKFMRNGSDCDDWQYFCFFLLCLNLCVPKTANIIVWPSSSKIQNLYLCFFFDSRTTKWYFLFCICQRRVYICLKTFFSVYIIMMMMIGEWNNIIYIIYKNMLKYNFIYVIYKTKDAVKKNRQIF